jgi:hypothetical protein
MVRVPVLRTSRSVKATAMPALVALDPRKSLHLAWKDEVDYGAGMDGLRKG